MYRQISVLLKPSDRNVVIESELLSFYSIKNYTLHDYGLWKSCLFNAKCLLLFSIKEAWPATNNQANCSVPECCDHSHYGIFNDVRGVCDGILPNKTHVAEATSIF